LKVAIYQGERDMVHNNRKLGEFILKGIPPMPAGLPKIEVRFMLDANGLLTVGAKELRSGIDQSIDINSAYSIAEEEMGRMLMDSTINAKEDIKQKAIVEASVVIQSTKKFIGQNASWLNEENKNEFNRFIDNVQNKIESNSKDEIYKSLIELNKYAEPFAHEALDRSVLAALSGTKIPPKS
jgi:molecular chaperone HscA